MRKLLLCVLLICFSYANAQLKLPKEVTNATDDPDWNEWELAEDGERPVYKKEFEFSEEGLKALYKEITELLNKNNFKFASPTELKLETGDEKIDFKNAAALHANFAGNESNWAQIAWERGSYTIQASLWDQEYYIVIFN